MTCRMGPVPEAGEKVGGSCHVDRGGRLSRPYGPPPLAPERSLDTSECRDRFSPYREVMMILPFRPAGPLPHPDPGASADACLLAQPDRNLLRDHLTQGAPPTTSPTWSPSKNGCWPSRRSTMTALVPLLGASPVLLWRIALPTSRTSHGQRRSSLGRRWSLLYTGRRSYLILTSV